MNYSPYGTPWQQIGTPQTVYGFTGEPLDENGLLHLRARYLDPALGVFISLDLLETANRYSYVEGNPVNYSDPRGLQSGGYEHEHCFETGGWRECYGCCTANANTSDKELSECVEFCDQEFRDDIWALSDTILSCRSLLTDHFAVDRDQIESLCRNAEFDPFNWLKNFPFLSETQMGTTAVSDRSNRLVAASYAIRYSTTPGGFEGSDVNDPRYPFIMATNCTAFTSQSLKEGGFPEDKAGGWWINEGETTGLTPTCVDRWWRGGDCGLAWVATPDLETYLLTNAGFSHTDYRVIAGHPEIQLLTGNPANVLPGDVVFFYQSDDSQVTPNTPGHAGVIIGWGPSAEGPYGSRRLNLTSRVPWFADNSGAEYIRPINDIGSGYSNLTRIVHIQY